MSSINAENGRNTEFRRFVVLWMLEEGSRPEAAPYRILVVEDNLDDERLTLRALRHGRLPLDVRVARSVEEAESALGLDEPGASYRPDLVLLSLERLRCDEAHGVLALARRHSHLASVPVVVFASAVDDGAEARCLAAGASAHATKPIGIDAYTELVRNLVKRLLNRADGRL